MLTEIRADPAPAEGNPKIPRTLKALLELPGSYRLMIFAYPYETNMVLVL